MKKSCKYKLCTNYKRGAKGYCCAGCSCDDHDYLRLKAKKKLKALTKKKKYHSVDTEFGIVTIEDK